MTTKAKVTKKELKDDELVSINEACRLTGLSRVYIHRSITKFKTLPTTKVPINNKGQYKHMIKVGDLKKWRATRKGTSKRDDGRNKYTSYMNPEEEKLLIELVKAEPRLKGIELFRTNLASRDNS